MDTRAPGTTRHKPKVWGILTEIPSSHLDRLEIELLLHGVRNTMPAGDVVCCRLVSLPSGAFPWLWIGIPLLSPICERVLARLVRWHTAWYRLVCLRSFVSVRKKLVCFEEASRARRRDGQVTVAPGRYAPFKKKPLGQPNCLFCSRDGQSGTLPCRADPRCPPLDKRRV